MSPPLPLFSSSIYNSVGEFNEATNACCSNYFTHALWVYLTKLINFLIKLIYNHLILLFSEYFHARYFYSLSILIYELYLEQIIWVFYLSIVLYFALFIYAPRVSFGTHFYLYLFPFKYIFSNFCWSLFLYLIVFI